MMIVYFIKIIKKSYRYQILYDSIEPVGLWWHIFYMNYEDALAIFEWDATKVLEADPADLRRQYRKLCLKYHPDKNGSHPEYIAKFQLVQNAYMILLDEFGEGSDSDHDTDQEDDQDLTQFKMPNSWEEVLPLLPKWLQPVVVTIMEYKDSPILISVVKVLEQRITHWAENIDKVVLKNIYDFVSRISPKGVGVGVGVGTGSRPNNGLDFLEKILAETIQKKTALDRYVKLEPNLEDLFSCNLIRHIEDTNTEYMIPTWIEESVFDISGGGELIFHCDPKCPLGVEIDQKRNIHCRVSYMIQDIFQKSEEGTIEVSICPGVSVEIDIPNLYLRKYQTVILRGKGIPIGSSNDVLDVSKRSDIIIHVFMVQDNTPI